VPRAAVPDPAVSVKPDAIGCIIAGNSEA